MKLRRNEHCPIVHFSTVVVSKPNRKVAEQGRKWGICHDRFTDCSEIVSDHIEPRRIGGARRDDLPKNIQALHRRCN